MACKRVFTGYVPSDEPARLPGDVIAFLGCAFGRDCERAEALRLAAKYAGVRTHMNKPLPPKPDRP